MNSSHPSPRAVAEAAFGHFCHGLRTGQWASFLAMLTEDFVFWFPMGAYRGENRGKARAEAFFGFVSQVFPEGLTVTLDRVSEGGNTVVFEFRDEGQLRGQPYENRVALSFEVRGDKLCGYREYFGLVHSEFKHG